MRRSRWSSTTCSATGSSTTASWSIKARSAARRARIPVTYIKAFDEIRAVFAETVEARTRNYTAGHFSFNVDGGRCGACEGDGYIAIDMQFLADVYMKCPQCGGRRYRREILDVKYRGRNIAEVLEMTVREAFTFFRGQPKVQARLKRLIDVGLDYSASASRPTRSPAARRSGSSWPATSAAKRRGRCLFLLDEPTTGLHFSDVVQLLDCFDGAAGRGPFADRRRAQPAVMRRPTTSSTSAPAPPKAGGRIVAAGTPEAGCPAKESITGRFLAASLAEEAARAGRA